MWLSKIESVVLLAQLGRARAVVVVVDVTRRRERGAEVVVGGDALNRIRDRVVLTAQRDGAPLVALEAHVSLAAEQARTLAHLARADIEAAFQREDRLQAAAKIFTALQAPAVAAEVAVDHARQVAVRVGVVNVADTCIDQPVERDAVLCMSRDRHRAQRECNSRNCSSFHLFLYHSFKNVLRSREYRCLKVDKLLVGYMQLISFPAFYKAKKAMRIHIAEARNHYSSA